MFVFYPIISLTFRISLLKLSNPSSSSSNPISLGIPFYSTRATFLSYPEHRPFQRISSSNTPIGSSSSSPTPSHCPSPNPKPTTTIQQWFILPHAPSQPESLRYSQPLSLSQPQTHSHPLSLSQPHNHNSAVVHLAPRPKSTRISALLPPTVALSVESNPPSDTLAVHWRVSGYL